MTQRTYGLGALALPLLGGDPRLDVVGLLHVSDGGGSRRPWRRVLRKVRRIGPVGALNGVRMRRWYGQDLAQALDLRPVDEVAVGLGVPVVRVPGPGAPETERALRDWGADAALSLGNGYIPERVFSVPPLGMVNVHHELLPDFRGAQGVIWQLHEGSATTGFTIHAIDRSLDTGAVLLREEVPIRFGRTLGETVTTTMAELYRRSADRLSDVLANLEDLLRTSPPQGPGRSFTTPSLTAYRRIVENHTRLAGLRGGS